MKRGGQRGIALVLVTWVFMILGVLALDFARYMRDDAEAAVNLAEETRNYYVAVGAMNRAIYDLEQGEHGDVGNEKEEKDEEEEDEGTEAGGQPAEGGLDDADLTAADGEWHEEVLNGARFGVRVTDEGALISLNDAAQEVGATLLRHVVKMLLGYGGTAGMDRGGDVEISTVVDSIVDWYDRNDEEGVHGAESRFYLDREPPYPAKNGDFDSIEELLQVRGVTPALYYGSNGMPGLKDVFTPYVVTKAEHPKVNLQRAPAAVLQALLGIDAEEAAELIELRQDQDPEVFRTQVLERLRTIDPVIAEQTKGGGPPKVVRVEARADVSVPRNQARVAAVVKLTSEISEGIVIMRWFDRAPWQGGLPTGSGDGPA